MKKIRDKHYQGGGQRVGAVILSKAKDLSSAARRSFAALRACPERSEGMTAHGDRRVSIHLSVKGKLRPYPVRSKFIPVLSSYRVGAGLRRSCGPPALVTLIAFLIICATGILFTISMPPKVMAQGNVFIVTMPGSTQPPGFVPDLLAVHVYDTVVFVNSATAPIAIVAVDNSFSSSAIAPGKQWKVTFNSAGAFEYHEISPTPRIFGEIVVVPNTVALLPSPVPAAQETAIAFIKAGKTPPDTVWQPTAPQVQASSAAHPLRNQSTSSLSVPPLALLMTFVRPVILVVIILLALFVSGLAGLWLFRRQKPRKKEGDEDEDDTDE